MVGHAPLDCCFWASDMTLPVWLAPLVYITPWWGVSAASCRLWLRDGERVLRVFLCAWHVLRALSALKVICRIKKNFYQTLIILLIFGFILLIFIFFFNNTKSSKYKYLIIFTFLVVLSEKSTWKQRVKFVFILECTKSQFFLPGSVAFILHVEWALPVRHWARQRKQTLRH